MIHFLKKNTKKSKLLGEKKIWKEILNFKKIILFQFKKNEFFRKKI